MHKNLEIIPSSNNHRFAERHAPSTAANASFGRVYDEVRSNTPPQAKEKNLSLDQAPKTTNSSSGYALTRLDANSAEKRANTQQKAETATNKPQADKADTIASGETRNVNTDAKNVGSDAATLVSPKEDAVPVAKAVDALAMTIRAEPNRTRFASLEGAVIDADGNSSPSLAAVSSLLPEAASALLEGTGASLVEEPQVNVLNVTSAEKLAADAGLSAEGLGVAGDYVASGDAPLETEPLLTLEGDLTGLSQTTTDQGLVFKDNPQIELDATLVPLKEAPLNLVGVALNNAELESTTDELDWVVAQMTQKGGIPYTGIIKSTDKISATLTAPAFTTTGVAVNSASISDITASIDGLMDVKTGLALGGNTDNIKNMTMLTNVDQKGAVFTSVMGDGDNSINLDGELIVADMDIDAATFVLKNSDAADLLEGKPNQSNTLDQRLANMTQSLAAASLQQSPLAGQANMSGLAASPVPNTSLVMNVPPTHQNWTPEMGEKVVWMARAGIKSAEIRLDPPELGSLIVKLSLDNDSASVSFIAATPQVRDLLEGQMHRLREMLSQQGLDLTNVDVNVSHQQAGTESGQDDARNGSANQSGEAEDLLGEVEGARVSYVNASGVDFYA